MLKNPNQTLNSINITFAHIACIRQCAASSPHDDAVITHVDYILLLVVLEVFTKATSKISSVCMYVMYVCQCAATHADVRSVSAEP